MLTPRSGRQVRESGVRIVYASPRDAYEKREVGLFYTPMYSVSVYPVADDPTVPALPVVAVDRRPVVVAAGPHRTPVVSEQSIWRTTLVRPLVGAFRRPATVLMHPHKMSAAVLETSTEPMHSRGELLKHAQESIIPIYTENSILEQHQ